MVPPHLRLPGVIHGDFERGFIAADIVSYSDLITAGSLSGARAAGHVRTEGKTLHHAARRCG
jgi:ribosome-binding ATPase YchF (GTP1/OBG family)